MTTLNSKTIFISICISFNSSDWSSQWKVCSLALHVHLVLQGWVTSGRSRGGPESPISQFFWVKKEKKPQKEEKPTGQAKQNHPSPLLWLKIWIRHWWLHWYVSGIKHTERFSIKPLSAWRETERKTVFHCRICSSPEDSDIFASRQLPNPLLLLVTLEKNETSLQKPYVFYGGPFFRAMSSSTNKEQFLKQFDSIVRGIVDNKERVGQPSMCFPTLATGFMFSRACHSLCFPALITLGFTFLLRVLIG